ncbi:MAG: maltose ABC transporter substrate-binding protein, partial [Lachnospiraceae bacterium]|nr:maltose ABC transporter substrate-binding protein [Lachnospiraceae bacterium]
MFATVFSGCSGKDASQNTDNAEVTENTNEESSQAQELQSGKVDLRLWIDEGSVPNTQKMIDSFKQQYAGQAD